MQNLPQFRITNYALRIICYAACQHPQVFSFNYQKNLLRHSSCKVSNAYSVTVHAKPRLYRSDVNTHCICYSLLSQPLRRCKHRKQHFKILSVTSLFHTLLLSNPCRSNQVALQNNQQSFVSCRF